MLRTLSTVILASIAAGHVYADGSAQSNVALNQNTFTAQLSADANQKQLRRLLAGQGYIVTSELILDESGRWIGSALKDGKTVNVALKLPVKASTNSFTN